MDSVDRLAPLHNTTVKPPRTEYNDRLSTDDPFTTCTPQKKVLQEGDRPGPRAAGRRVGQPGAGGRAAAEGQSKPVKSVPWIFLGCGGLEGGGHGSLIDLDLRGRDAIIFYLPPQKKVNHLLALIKGAPHPETRLLAAQQMQVGG